MMPSDLLKKQWEFARMVPKLIAKANELGYECSIGEVYRTPEQARINAENGSGVANSLHTKRLAVDLLLFKKTGEWLSRSEDYEVLGVYWESIGGSWGGRFSKPDGNHFSLSYQGVR